MLVIVAPGQGAQTPGFLEPWLADPTYAERMRWLSAVADLDLVHYGTKADADTIRDTSIAQPLLVASALVTALELFPHPADAFDKIGAVAGHSVGELAAAAGARAITAEQAMVLVRERGKAMAQAAAATPTSMTAVLGGDREEVLAKLEQHGLTAANDNGPGQIVAAGTVEQLAALAADPPAKARLTPLSVAGAFHTQHMAPAVDHVAGARPLGLDPRPAHPGDLQPRRPRRPRRPRACSTGSSPRSAPRSAGTSAWRRCSTSASPGSSRCRPPAPSPASPGAR